MSDHQYQYNRFGSKGMRVGQAVSDILSKEQPVQTAGDIIDAYSAKYASELEKAIEDSKGKYKNPFYVLALTKKEYWTDNVVRNWFIPRQTAPYALDMMIQYPNHTKTLYVINYDRGDLKVAWSIPGHEDCKSVLKTPDDFSPELVQWIKDCYNGNLNKDRYDELFQ